MMADTPLTDLQLLLSRGVDMAHALPGGSVDQRFVALVALYLAQIAGAVVLAESSESSVSGVG